MIETQLEQYIRISFLLGMSVVSFIYVFAVMCIACLKVIQLKRFIAENKLADKFNEWKSKENDVVKKLKNKR